jgi:hypothetical protein
MYKRNTTCTKEIQHVQKKYNMYKSNKTCTKETQHVQKVHLKKIHVQKKYNMYNSSHHWRTLIFHLCNVEICNILETDMVMKPPLIPIEP